MRVFKRFNDSNGDVCPVCKTAAQRETVLVPIPGTEKGKNIQCTQVHKECFDLVQKMYNTLDKKGQEKVLLELY